MLVFYKSAKHEATEQPFLESFQDDFENVAAFGHLIVLAFGIPEAVELEEVFWSWRNNVTAIYQMKVFDRDSDIDQTDQANQPII